MERIKITSYKSIDFGDEDELIRVLSTQGPVSIALDVNAYEILYYKSGIIDSAICSKERLNHAVIAVGYNLTGKIPYLIVKNRFYVFKI